MNRLSFLICALLLFAFDCLCQNKDVDLLNSYNTETKRLLIKVVSAYLFNFNRWQINYDSVIVMACEAEGVKHSLYRNESFDDGTALPGSQLIESGNLAGAGRLLTTLQGEDRIKLFLQLGAYYLFRPGNNANDMKSSFRFLSEAQTISDALGIPKWKNASHSMLGKYYFNAGDFPKSKAYFSEVISFCSQAGDKKGLAHALADRGSFTLFTDTNRLKDFTQALELFRKQNDKVRVIEMLTRMGEVHFIYNLYDQCEKELLEAVRLGKEIGYKHTHYYYNTLSYIELEKGNSNIALSYSNKVIAKMEETNDRAFAPIFYFRVGNSYGAIADWDKAIYWYRKSVESSVENNVYAKSYKTYSMLAYTLTSAGRYKEALDLINTTLFKFPNLSSLDSMYLAMAQGRCYENSKQKSLAEKYFVASASLADRLSSQPVLHNDIAGCYLDIASFYIDKAEMNKAKYYLQKLVSPQSKFVPIRHQIDLALLQFRIDSSEGKYISAIQAYQRYKKLNDVIFNLRKTRQIDEMGIQYNVAQKEKDVQLLQKQGRLQLAELEHEKLTRNIIILVTVLLVILFVLGYSRYRIKQRHSREIDEKNIALENLIADKDKLIEDKDSLLKEKDWLVKEIHHRVKNNLQMVISLLNAQAEFLKQPSALNAIRESRERMQAIAILHQKLYQLENSTRINMRSYINELVENIKSSMADSGRIYFEMKMANVGLDISQSVPLALIINEALTNAIKYAYPKNQKGNIQISLQPRGEDQLQLKIADHGKGLPPDVDLENSNSLGLQLIKLFSEQLEGNLFFINKEGLEIILNFRTAEFGNADDSKKMGITA